MDAAASLLTDLPITAAAAGILGILQVTLALNVTLMRIRFRVSSGDGGLPLLDHAIRAHGNTAEHVPLFLILCLALELAGGGRWLAVAAALFVLGRCAHTWGMFLRQHQLVRRIGIGLSYSMTGSVALALLLRPAWH